MDEDYHVMKPAEDYVSWVMRHPEKTTIWEKEAISRSVVRVEKNWRTTQTDHLKKVKRDWFQLRRVMAEDVPQNVVKAKEKEIKAIEHSITVADRKIEFHQDVLVAIRRRMKADSRFTPTPLSLQRGKTI